MKYSLLQVPEIGYEPSVAGQRNGISVVTVESVVVGDGSVHFFKNATH